MSGWMTYLLRPRLPEDSEPVFYCLSCHSLAVKRDPALACGGWDGSWCASCGGTEVGECLMDEWLEAERRMRRDAEDMLDDAGCRRLAR